MFQHQDLQKFLVEKMFRPVQRQTQHRNLVLRNICAAGNHRFESNNQILKRVLATETTALRRYSKSLLQLNNSLGNTFTSPTNKPKIKSVSIGSIRLYQSKDGKDDDNSLFIPNYSLQLEDHDKSQVEHLKWIAMKDQLGQDIFLIGHYGEMKRHLAFQYCQLARRSVEYVCITRDTSEHDFKQRREIESGSAFYVDQAAVRAAKNGSILILDGMEKSDRNILPILNNLMENR